MNKRLQILTINDVITTWIKYIEMFNSSKATISYFRNKNYSWDEIERIFAQALKNKKEIQLDSYE